LGNFLSQRSDEFMVSPFSLRTVIVSIIRTAFALSHDIVSANWIFAFDPLSDLVQRAYPTNVIKEEIFLAKKAGVLAYLPALSLALLVALGGWIMLRAWRLPEGLLRRRPMIVVLLWLGINGAIIGRLNPAGVEAWIMVLAPIALVAAAFVIEPCVRRGRVLVIAAFVTVLFFHNLVGGMALMFDPQGEYNKVKGAWVIDNARSNDLVIVPADADLVEALRYLSPAQVALIAMGDIPKVADSLAGQDLESLYTRTRGRDFDHHILRRLIENARDSGGRVIVFSDFFVPPPSRIQAEWPAFAAVEALREKATRVYETPDAGDTYVLPVPVQ
jgi:predicted nuclease of predicted toxin-antitoxin system